ncbi:ATP-binding protein [Nonomuraea sp. SYSU D8015]|uniref:ATP-binding protein n=1 Tax=Nonomuraea sp. SYSU D8015 TaxID=2593644 RepID=UPI001CB6DF0D|nr:ATP-binding protein [Nonomuraea sp. SYSU D8015]
MTEHVIAVVGSSPGVGKSTLCGALARWIGGTGTVVDHFEESDVLTRAPFRAVAEEFAGGAGSVRPRTLVEATRAYVEQAREDGVDVLVTDALIPFVPSLVAWGHDETAIAQVVRDLEEAVAPTRVSVVFLHDAPEAALRRAIEREGPEWLDWYVGKLGRSPGTRDVHDLESAADHLRRESELTLRVLAATRWNVVVVEVGGRDAAQVEQDVREALQGSLSDRT